MNEDISTRKLKEPIKKIYTSSWSCGLWEEICYNENSRTGMVIEFECQLKFNYNHVYDAMNMLIKSNATLRTVFEKQQGILYRNILPHKKITLRNHISFTMETEWNEDCSIKEIDNFFTRNLKPDDKAESDNCLWNLKVIMYPQSEPKKESEEAQVPPQPVIRTTSMVVWNYVLLFQCQQYLFDSHSAALFLRDYLNSELNKIREIEIDKEEVAPSLEKALSVTQFNKYFLGGWDEIKSRLKIHFGQVKTFIPEALKENELTPELKQIMNNEMDMSIQFQSVLRRCLDLPQTKALHHNLRRNGISLMALMQVVVQASFCQMTKSCDNISLPRNVFVRIEKYLRMLLPDVYDDKCALGSSKLRLTNCYKTNPLEDSELLDIFSRHNMDEADKNSPSILWNAARKRQALLDDTRSISTYKSILNANYYSSLPFLPDFRPTLMTTEHFLIDELILPDELGYSLRFLTKQQRNICETNIWPTEKKFKVLSRYHVILEPNMLFPTFSFSIFEGKLMISSCWSRGKGCLLPEKVAEIMDGIVELLNQITKCEVHATINKNII